MDEDIKLLEDLYEEMNEFCNIHSYNSCRGCYIEELRRKYEEKAREKQEKDEKKLNLLREYKS